MKRYLKVIVGCWIAAAMGMSCQDMDEKGNLTKGRFALQAEVMTSKGTTRVNDNGFCDGDVLGVYIVNYEGNMPGTLQDRNNHADNVPHTFDQESNRLEAPYDIYWKDQHTHVDVYGYYPYGTHESVRAVAFEVQKDQSMKEMKSNATGGYEKSDFLWGKATDVTPTEANVRLSLRHIMAQIQVTLKEGSGFDTGEWDQLKKQVQVQHTIHSAVIDLANGEVKTKGEVTEQGIVPARTKDGFKAIVVPQTVRAGKSLFAIDVNSVPYVFKKKEDFVYEPGRTHRFTITVNKKLANGDYEWTLSGESIVPWEEDMESHEATAKGYVVIHVDRRGTLEECLRKAKKDPTLIYNLKVTGEINTNDYKFIKEKMPKLEALNLMKVTTYGLIYNTCWPELSSLYEQKDAIPELALNNISTLTSLILPEKVEHIGYQAFNGCTHLLGSIYIPEGVKYIDKYAFCACGYTNELRLPSTLRRIGYSAFEECNFSGKLKLPKDLEYIGMQAFMNATGLNGELVLPDRLTYIGNTAFANCKGFTGSLVIPPLITKIEYGTFFDCPFNGTLTLPDGIVDIDESAFNRCQFTGKLQLPKNLKQIGKFAFAQNLFEGELVLPKELTRIGEGCFYGCNKLTGTLVIPEKVLLVDVMAFYQCSGLTEVHFPKELDQIGKEAFAGCTQLKRIVCKRSLPMVLQAGAFNGVDKENTVVEVPLNAVEQYRKAEGWKEFKHIVANQK